MGEMGSLTENCAGSEIPRLWVTFVIEALDSSQLILCSGKNETEWESERELIIKVMVVQCYMYTAAAEMFRFPLVSALTIVNWIKREGKWEDEKWGDMTHDLANEQWLRLSFRSLHYANKDILAATCMCTCTALQSLAKERLGRNLEINK